VLIRPGLQELTAHALNVSAGGIGLLLDHPLEVGTVLAFVLGRDRLRASGLRSARVVHATLRRPGQWLIGCRLSAPLSTAALLALSR
jgi:hypothetical protein